MLEGQGVIELGEVSHHGELVRPGRRDHVLHLQQRRDAETLISHAECHAQVPEKLEREVNTNTMQTMECHRLNGCHPNLLENRANTQVCVDNVVCAPNNSMN